MCVIASPAGCGADKVLHEKGSAPAGLGQGATPRVVYKPLMAMRLGFAVSTFGTATVITPALSAASTWSASKASESCTR